MVCDGENETTCDNANAKECSVGLIVMCKPGFKLVSSTSCEKCTGGLICPGDNTSSECKVGFNSIKECNTTGIAKCIDGKHLRADGASCEDCGTNLRCDGTTTEINC